MAVGFALTRNNVTQALHLLLQAPVKRLLKPAPSGPPLLEVPQQKIRTTGHVFLMYACYMYTQDSCIVYLPS